MTTPTGTIGMSDVNVELGKSSTALISLNDADVRSLAGIPSGTISMNDLRGKSNLAAVLNDYSAGTYNIQLLHTYSLFGSSVEAYVEIVLDSSGTAYYRYGDTGTPTTNFTSFTWKTGGGGVGDYYAHMATPSGDAFSTGSSATNTALALSTTRSWILRASASAFNDETLSNNSTIQIRNSGGTALASKTISMYAFAAGY